MRFATFNMLHGRSIVDGRVDVDRFAAAVRSLDADVLALQEVDRDQPRSGQADFTSVAAEAMGAVSHRFVAALSGTPGATWIAATGEEQPGTATYGIALLSRCPVKSWQIIRLESIPVKFPMLLKHPRKVVMVHDEPRVAVAATVDTPLGVITVASTHLSFVPGWNRLQLRRLRRDLAALSRPLVLMGDLNMSLATATRTTGYESLLAQPTFPASDPRFQLDHVLVDGSLPGVRKVDVPLLELSDHRAVTVEI